jgi:copper(I)-binding protein
MRPLLRVCALALLGAATVASAVEVQVKNAWVRSATQGQAATPAYVDIRSDTPLRLVGATSPWARSVEIRTLKLQAGLPSEKAVAALDVAAGAEFRLAPGGSYLALVDVQRAFGNGDFVPITLRFEDAKRTVHTVDLEAQARGLLLAKPPAAKTE